MSVNGWAWKALLLALMVGANLGRGDIYQWEYVDPADPNQGKRQSTILTNGGAGVDAVPDADLERRGLAMAYLIGADLTRANLRDATLDFADLTGANLTGASLRGSNLDQTIFTDAFVRGVNFWGTTNDEGDGFTAEQFYSTASYKYGDLGPMNFEETDLSNWDLSYQDLSGAWFEDAVLLDVDFSHATLHKGTFRYAALSGANFTGADISEARLTHSTVTGFTAAQFYSTATYQTGDLSGIILIENDLSGWDFTGKKIENTFFDGSDLTDSEFAGATILGSSFEATNGFSESQLYATASYQEGDLTGVGLSKNDLSGWSFKGKNLSKARLSKAKLTNTEFSESVVAEANFAYTTSLGFTQEQLYSTASYQARDLHGINLWRNGLAGWDFRGQNLTNSQMSGEVLNPADFQSADTRGARHIYLGRSTNTNTIRPDGSILGLDLTDSRSLLIRNYQGDPKRSVAPISILVENESNMDSSGLLELQFDGQEWHSLISFSPGIEVFLDGTLLLDFEIDIDVRSQRGRTIRVFNWNGVTPGGEFEIVSPHQWNTSQLYLTGEITLVPEPASVSLLTLCLLSLCLKRTQSHVFAAR